MSFAPQLYLTTIQHPEQYGVNSRNAYNIHGHLPLAKNFEAIRNILGAVVSKEIAEENFAFRSEKYHKYESDAERAHYIRAVTNLERARQSQQKAMEEYQVVDISRVTYDPSTGTDYRIVASSS